MEMFTVKKYIYRKLANIVVYAAMLFFIYLMLLITIQYIPINFNAAFLAVKQDEIKHLHYQVAFFTHVYTSILVLIFGLFQFSKYLRKHFIKLHKTLGKLYVFIILFLASPSGFIMGYYGNGGLYSKISFCLLATLWFYFTLMAFIKIKQRKIALHKNYMILSYALTLSAISLRLFKFIIANTIALPPMDTYTIVVWLGWLFNLCVALFIIKTNKEKLH